MQSYPKPASRDAINAPGIESKVNESPKAVGIDAKMQKGEAPGAKSIVSGGAACNVKGYTGGGVIDGKV